MGKKQNFLARPPPPPDQNFRKKPGNFKAKLDKKENKEVESAAIARKQEPLPIKKVLLGLAAFGAVCALLYTYLNYISDEDDIDVLMAAAAEKAAAAKAAAAAAAAAAATPTPAEATPLPTT